MTVSQIEKLGFPHITGRKFYFESLNGQQIVIPDYYNIYDIHRIIFEKGVEIGKEEGIKIQTNKLRDLLGFDEIN